MRIWLSPVAVPAKLMAGRVLMIGAHMHNVSCHRNEHSNVTDHVSYGTQILSISQSQQGGRGELRLDPSADGGARGDPPEPHPNHTRTTPEPTRVWHVMRIWLSPDAVPAKLMAGRVLMIGVHSEHDLFLTDVCLLVYNPLLACRSTTSASGSLSTGAHGLSKNSPPASTTSCMDRSDGRIPTENLPTPSSTTRCMDRSNGRMPTDLAPVGQNGKNTTCPWGFPRRAAWIATMAVFPPSSPQ